MSSTPEDRPRSLDHLGLCSGERRYRASRRQHRDQSASVSGARPGARLPRLLRSTSEFELFLLRRHVLGLPGGQLVRELLVQRALGARDPGGGAAVRPARPCALLPTTSCVLSRLAFGCAATLGRALGQCMGAKSKRMEQLESPRCTRASPTACIPATICWDSLSARRAAAGASKSELPLSTARHRSAAALSGAADAKCARVFSAGNAADAKCACVFSAGNAASAKCARVFSAGNAASASG
jgi:hypothetical protein